MKQTRLLTLLIACLALPVFAAEEPATAPATPAVVAPEAGKPLGKVNGETIPAIYGNFIYQNRKKRNMPPEALADGAIKDGAITTVLLAQEAVKKGLDKNPTVEAAIEFQRKELLVDAYINDYLRANPIKEETIKAEYDNAKAKAGDVEYHARHILVGSEKEAREIIAKLGSGKKSKFEEMARKDSKDTSAENGGDLGWILPTNLVPEFAQAMVGLKKGEITKTPVQTRFGWHIIRMEETRKLDFPEYDKVKNRIAGQLQQQQIAKLVKELAATSKIE